MTKRPSFATLLEHQRAYTLWPQVDLSQLSAPDRVRAERLAAGIVHYLKTGKLKQACTLAECEKQTLYDQLARCLEPTEDGLTLIGWPALIRHKRVVRYQRSQSASGKRDSGFAGAFQQFLEAHGHIYKKLISFVRSGGGSEGVKSSSPSKMVVYKAFRTYCLSRDGGLTERDYPFNTQNAGRRAVGRFVEEFSLSDSKSLRTWYGVDEANRVRLGTGKKSFRFGSAPFEVVGSDTHTVHCIGTILIDGPVGPQPVVINRLLFHPVIDEYLGCVLSYSAAFNSTPSAALVEDALAGLSKKWEPRECDLPEFEYPKGAMLPVGNIAGLDEIRPCIVKFDNAAAHYAKKVSISARRYLGAAIAYGPIREWSWNAICERLFLTLAKYGIQQISSSTGSNTADPLRPDFVVNAVRDCITWKDVLALIDLCVATHNMVASAGIGGQSPLEALRNQLELETFVPRPPVPLGPLAPRVGVTIKIVRIAGRTKGGQIKTPYVQLDRVHYGGECISRRFDLFKSQVIAHIDESDMRSFKIYSMGGEYMGELVALDSRWARTKHSRADRKEILRMIARRELEPNVADYVMAFLMAQRVKARKEIKNNPLKKSRAATKMAETMRSSGISELPPETVRPPLSSVTRRPVPSFIPNPSWSKK